MLPFGNRGTVHVLVASVVVAPIGDEDEGVAGLGVPFVKNQTPCSVAPFS